MLLEGSVSSFQSLAMLICISKALSHSQLQRECFGPPKEYYLGQYPISCMVTEAAGCRNGPVESHMHYMMLKSSQV